MASNNRPRSDGRSLRLRPLVGRVHSCDRSPICPKMVRGTTPGPTLIVVRVFRCSAARHLSNPHCDLAVGNAHKASPHLRRRSVALRSQVENPRLNTPDTGTHDAPFGLPSAHGYAVLKQRDNEVLSLQGIGPLAEHNIYSRNTVLCWYFGAGHFSFTLSIGGPVQLRRPWFPPRSPSCSIRNPWNSTATIGNSCDSNPC
jgi:hypothetical protein